MTSSFVALRTSGLTSGRTTTAQKDPSHMTENLLDA